MANVITLYDIPNQTPAENLKARPWSSNTWKTRFALGFKNIPFKTVWVEYPDIAALYKQIGVQSSSRWSDGTPKYTLPVIYDPSTDRAISDSQAISVYLDATYPDRPRLMPEGTVGLQHAFQAALDEVAMKHYHGAVMLSVYRQLRPRSQAYFRRTREAAHGCALEEIPAGVDAEGWRKTEAGFKRIRGWIEANGEGSRWIMGDEVSYADLWIAAKLVWVRQAGAREEWEMIRSWDGGFWARFVDHLERYEVYDQGEEFKP